MVVPHVEAHKTRKPRFREYSQRVVSIVELVAGKVQVGEGSQDVKGALHRVLLLSSLQRLFACCFACSWNVQPV